MAGLMMVFLFIAVSFMIQVEKEKRAMTDIAITYLKAKMALNKELREEFEHDLDRWGAEILDDNTIRFQEPQVLFAASSSEITQKFKDILDDFFPRYVGILVKHQFREEIEEVRIEGHTSSEWYKDTAQELAYLFNAQLSQERSLSVLQYVYNIEEISKEREWLNAVIRANGLSFAKLIYHPDGTEDHARSRRVEFRVRTRTEEKIQDILKRSGASAEL
jgi:outer membrane protein OmpA-like peptidoglycan-associated protein